MQQIRAPGMLYGGRYRATALLKQSGGISTFAGTDLESHKAVIIKVVESGPRTPSALRFEHEAHVLRDAKSPYVTPLLAKGHHEGTLYLVIPFVEGRSLAERLESGPLSVADTLVVGIEVLNALDDAHVRGILHRDVKPSNVIVDRTDPIKRATLIDFGLARSDRLEQNLRDVPAGTLHYMSPELAGLIDRPVAPTSDLYAVGILLYECLAGAPPFRASGASELLRQHLAVAPPPLRGPADMPRVLEQVIQQLLAKDPRDRYQSAVAARHDLLAIESALARGIAEPSLAIGGHDRRTTLTEPKFVGRQSEVRLLELAVDDAARGEGHLVLLEAPSGGGKSWLLAECVRRAAARGVAVYRGQGIDHGAQRPFQVIAGVISALALELGDDPVRAAQIADDIGDHAGAIIAALPELGANLPPRSGSGALGPESLAEMRSVRAIATLLDALGTTERPAVVVLDDFQWADDVSIQLLVRWAESAPAARHVTVLAAVRSEETPEAHPLRAVATRNVVLSLFERDAVERMAESMAGPLPAEVVSLVDHLAEGNPFMVSAILQGLVESGALVRTAGAWSSVAEKIAEAQSSRRAAVFLARRVRTLPANVLAALSVAAVVGKQFDVPLVARLAEIDEASARSALEEARHRHVVWLKGDGAYAFVHDKLRETLLHVLDAERRPELHLRAAEAIEADAPQRAFELAYHFDAAGEPGRALVPALEAAKEARGVHALDVAVRYLRIAARCAPESDHVRFEITKQLGELLMLRGRYDEAAPELATAASLAVTTIEKVHIEGQRGELAFKRGDIDAARDALERGIRLLGKSIPVTAMGFFFSAIWEVFIQVLHTALPRLFVGRRSLDGAAPELLLVHLHSRLAYAYWFGRGKFPCLWTHLREMNLAERYPPTLELAQAYSEHSPVMSMVPLYDRGIAYARRSLEIRREKDDVWGQGQSFHFLGVGMYAATRYEECIASCTEAVTLLERTGDLWEVNTALWNIAFSRYRLGDLAGAVEVSRRVHAAGSDIGDVQAMGIALGAWAKASGGRLPAALVDAELARTDTADVHTRAEILQAHAIRLLREGDPNEAVTTLETAQALVERRGLQQEYVAPVLPWMATALRMCLEALSPYAAAGERAGLMARARRVSRRSLKIARTYQNNLPHALREAGQIAALDGQPERAARFLDESVAVARAQHAIYEEALSRAARGRIGIIHGWPNADVDRREGETKVRTLEDAVAREERAEALVSPSLLDRFATLLEVGRRLASALSRDTAFEAARDAGERLLRPERCELVELTSDGVPTVSAPEHSHNLVARAIAARRPIAMTEFQGLEGVDAEAPTDSVVLSGARSAMYAPIFVMDKPAACLILTHARVGGLFGEEELRLAEFIATLAGVALENAAGFAQVQAAIGVRDDFLAIAGHELRTPLQVLSLQLQLLDQALARERADSAKSLRARAAKSLTAVTRIERLVGDLLDVSRLMSGHLKLEREPFDLEALTREVAERFSETIEKVGSTVTVTGDGAIVGHWDRARLDQVLTNLLANAVKYGRGKPIDITVSRKGAAIVRVRDRGIGIPEQDQARIFDRFERAVSVREFGGLGLGLWIVRQIVEAHGGSVSVESVAGEGATFTVTLPLDVEG